MRIAATAATLLFALASCSTTEQVTVSPYQQPNSLMTAEINQRIQQIPYQHREELVQNLLWLEQTGEQTILALISGLKHEHPKVRSSCCWVLGRLRDRRTVVDLQKVISDKEVSVRMEAARSLVLMGDLEQSPKLIEGLDSDRTEVRYMCHEALKSATGHDFGYDHLNQSQQDLQLAVLRWRNWWGEYSGDQFFAANYEKAHGLNNFAVPGGETQKQPSPPQPNPQQPNATPEPTPQSSDAANAIPSKPVTETTSKPDAQPAVGSSSPESPQGTAPSNTPVQPTGGNGVPPSVPPVVDPAGSADPSSGSPQSNPIEIPANTPAAEVPAAEPVPVEVPGGNASNAAGSGGNSGNRE